MIIILQNFLFDPNTTVMTRVKRWRAYEQEAMELIETQMTSLTTLLGSRKAPW